MNTTSTKTFIIFIRRFHVVIFIVLTVLILSVAVIMLYGIVLKATGMESIDESSTLSSFDKETMREIRDLKESSEDSPPLNLSQGRTNPFVE